MNYSMTARALRLASANAATKKLYRSLGNAKNFAFGGREEIQLKYRVTERQLTEVLDAYDIVKPGMRVMEMGTGWVHWDSLVLRNKVKCSVLLYDVWDNRSFKKFINYSKQLADENIRRKLNFQGAIDADLMNQLIECKDLDEAYRLLDFEYVLDETGRFRGISDNQFDLVISNAVFEHLRREHIPEILRRNYEVLRPGGWGIHLISLQDHLRIYAKSAHIKQYLTFSREEYDENYNNDVQYINLVQIPEWQKMFEDAGLEVVEMKRLYSGDLSRIEIDPSWGHMSEEDLACAVAQFVVRKPVSSALSDN